MRGNDARKWLHAGLDLLPLILIPVFMIYSHRHTMTQQTTIDIQYKYQSNEVNSLNDLIEGNIYYWDIESVDFSDLPGVNDLVIYLYQGYLEYDINNITYADDMNNSNYYSLYTYVNQNITEYNIQIPTTNGLIPSNYIYFDHVIIGFNNSSLFRQWLSLNGWDETLFEYTDYNLIESVEVHDETSSVMNVFMDNFNNAIDKYFNMGNVFGMTNVYQWFNTNIFNGQAPTIIFSVWNIVLYEFVMDLLFLLYGLFMWFIDIVKHIMEKPYRAIK